MKTKISIVFITCLFISAGIPAQVDRVEPPFWWTGMVNPHLQLMVHGLDIAGSNPGIDYPGVRVKQVSRLESPNYLFIDLEISGSAKPGSFAIEFKDGKKNTGSFTYRLLERKPGSAEREGFNSSDVICLITPDRFANGDPSNDIVTGMREKAVDRSDITGRHGGDLQGIIDHLDYLDKMGFTAIWLNPVLENDMDSVSYHGYSTTDYYRVDPRYGSNEDYVRLCEEARRRGIKVIMDMIFNHIGLRHWWMEDLPDGDWINGYPEYMITNHRRTVNQDPHASLGDRRRMVEGWFVRSMPDLNQRNPFLANYLIQNSIWWTEYAGLAGIRQDTYPYPEKDMMAEWNKRVLAEYPGFNIVGEEWSLNPGLISYWQRGQSNLDGYRGHLPSLMDFPLQNALTTSLLAEDGWDSGWIRLYETLASDFLYPEPGNLVIFPDNHDMPRFYMQLGMDPELYRLGIAFILTTRGIPQIYYGSEILMTHTEGDHHGYIRKDFPGGWEGDPVNGFTGEGLSREEKAMQQYFSTLLNWRKDNTVIHTGRLVHFAPEGGTYVYGRYNDRKSVMVILNKATVNVELGMDRFRELTGKHTGGTDVISGRRYDIGKKLEVPARTALILELE